jgi:hypothetical protein
MLESLDVTPSIGGRPSHQRAVQGIARDILRRPVGDRLQTTLEYQRILEVGAGTVQKALRLAEGVGAVRLRQAGHQGTFIEAHDLGLLWRLAELGHVRLALTPPGAVEHYALAIALAEEFERIDVPVGQHYVPGARRRIEILESSSVDVAVISRAAADALADDARWQLFELGPHTYYSEHSLVVVSRSRSRPGRGQAKQRVGIDRSSPDHTALTRAEFPADAGYEYVDCDFQAVPAAILEDKIDAGVWHHRELLVRLELMGLQARSLRQLEAQAIRRRLSNAVLVCQAQDKIVGAILAEIDLYRVAARQLALIAAAADGKHLTGIGWVR